jgi:hypothetical protein
MHVHVHGAGATRNGDDLRVRRCEQEQRGRRWGTDRRRHRRVILPVSTPLCEIKITDGGWIVAANGDRGSFGGNAIADAERRTTGQQQYQDHGPVLPTTLHGTVLVVTCNPDGSGTIFGRAVVDGIDGHYFRIDAKDVAEPGAGRDHYRIRFDLYDSADQVLRGGNVQAHKS